MLQLHLNVKFRAFGIDFGTIDRTFPIPEITVSVPPRVFFNAHGVLLELQSVASSGVAPLPPTPVNLEAHPDHPVTNPT